MNLATLAKAAGATRGAVLLHWDEASLVEALRRGDEAAFAWLVGNHHASLVRLAKQFVPTQADAEEVAQETWQALVEGLDRFEGRSSLWTWLLRILTNRARTRGAREGRSVPFSAVDEGVTAPEDPTVEESRFRAAPPAAGHWLTFPQAWDNIPEEQLISSETSACIEQAIEALPLAQRAVIALRDVEGCSAAEVCTMLGISETNQRVLLHRARSKVRRELARYLEREAST